MKIVGNKIYEICNGCGDMICLNKKIFGSMHICTTQEERIKYAPQISEKIKRMKTWMNT